MKDGELSTGKSDKWIYPQLVLGENNEPLLQTLAPESAHLVGSILSDTKYRAVAWISSFWLSFRLALQRG